MPDNLTFGPDAQANHAIAVMFNNKSTGEMKNGVQISPNVTLVVDTEGELEGTYTTGEEGVIDLSYRVVKPVRWVGLHINAGIVDLENKNIFGIIIKNTSSHAVTTRLCLRSFVEDRFEDTFLPKHIISYEHENIHIDLVQITKIKELIKTKLHREIILFLPIEEIDISINDLKIFFI